MAKKATAATVDEILQWANAHYDNGGHFIVETLTRDEVAQFPSLAAAKRWAALQQSHYRDIAAEEF